jgi:hypothetical protein
VIVKGRAMASLKDHPPVPYSVDVEKVDAHEHQVIMELSDTFRSMIQKTNDDLGHAQRGVHAKTHGLLQGQLQVLEDLPKELAQGLFKKGANYPVIIRLSAIPADPIRDSISVPRGFAMKVIQVAGQRLPGAEGQNTQDFLFANGSSFSAPTAEKFLGTLKLLAKTTDRAEWAKSALSAVVRPVEKVIEAMGGESGLLKTLGGYPATHPLGERYFTQAAIRFGTYMAKLDVVPASSNFKALLKTEVDYAGRHDALRDEVRDTLQNSGGAWTLRAQLCRNLKINPIEDASEPWPEKDNPYLPIATINIPAQQNWSAERAKKLEDEISFSPWHGITDHQPLGNVMRARRETYKVSSQMRSKLNGCPIHEPQRAIRINEAVE